MMGLLADTPSWGVLVRAPIAEVRDILASYAAGMIYRTNREWTAAFYMEPADSSDDTAANMLCSHGYAPVYHFDFARQEFMASVWDGARWTSLEKNGAFVDPDTVLEQIGITAPYWEKDQTRALTAKSATTAAREASVIEGATVEEVRALVGELHVEGGPVGAIVYDPSPETRFRLWDHAPGRVFEILFYPDQGGFRYRIMKGDTCLGTFRPGETRTWDGTPFLPSVDGDTDPTVIVEKLGIPSSFVKRQAG